MNPTQQHGAFLLRIALGIILLAHALLKIMVFTIPGTVAFFESIGLPAFTAYLTIFGELVGGIALLIGAYTRLAALLSVPILLGATWVHLANGWVFNSEGGGWEFPALLTVLALVIALQGAGSFAIRKLPVIDGLIPNLFKA
ncbi:MAG: DoxX family protein [Rhizobiaceae bacterium]